MRGSSGVFLIRSIGHFKYGDKILVMVKFNSISQAIMADDSNPHMFLIFFLTLAGCSLLSLPVTWCVRESREKPREDNNANTNKGFDSVE